MSIRNYSNTAAQSTLSANIGATDTTIALANYAGDPTPPFTAALARGTASEEIVLVTAVIGSTVTVTRGYDGTSAQAQSAGATFQEVVVGLDFREANNHVNDVGAVHGVTSQLVGVSDTQTLTNKTLTSPTISNPTVTGTQTVATSSVTTLTVSGVTTLAGFSASGNGSVGGTFAVTGLVKGGGVESTAGLTLAQIAAPAGVASKGQVWSQSDGGLYTRSGAGAANRLPVNWGSGTAFPASPLVGDTCVRTDVGTSGSYWQYAGFGGASGWLPQGEIVCTSSTRPGAGVQFVNLRIHETDTGEGQRWDGAAWRPQGRALHIPTLGTNWGGEILWTQTERTVVVQVHLLWNGGAQNPAAWTAVSAVLTGGSTIPVPHMGSGQNAITIGLLGQNSYEIPEFQVSIDNTGLLQIINRWAPHSFGTSGWFEGSFSYLTA